MVSYVLNVVLVSFVTINQKFVGQQDIAIDIFGIK